MTAQDISTTTISRAWWKEAVVYQVYPRSFQDSNGDGVGDLRGLINRLDYIQRLGVSVVWLNPIYASPNDDNGYDISDYRSIMAEMGTMADFDELLVKMHERGLKLVMDLVVNHTSDEHPWFVQSRSSRDNPYRDFYIWWPEEKGVPPRRWSYFDVDGSAWAWDEKTRSHYLHYFSVKQPDLNWDNPAVRREVYEMMKFWFDKGVDGFRMDVIGFISKDMSFPELPQKYRGNYPEYYAHGPRLHEYLQEMNREVLSKYDCFTVGEGAGVVIEDALLFVGEGRKELQMFFSFELVDAMRTATAQGGRLELSSFKRIWSRWIEVFAEEGWGSVYLGNHDFARMVSVWGDDSPEFRDASIKALLALLLTSRATPFVYYGDEIGMANVNFTSEDRFRDIESLNAIKGFKKGNPSADELHKFVVARGRTSRDNARTPMQWEAGEYGGFSEVTPWIEVNSDAKEVNVTFQEQDPDSPLNFFRRLTKLRKDELALVYGDYTLLRPEHSQLFMYQRTLGAKAFVIILNLSRESLEVTLMPDELPRMGEVLVSNIGRSGSVAPGVAYHLAPFEVTVVRVSS